jgi:menaquinone-specific isochorismate synthase
MTVTPYRHPVTKAPQPSLKPLYQSTIQATLPPSLLAPRGTVAAADLAGQIKTLEAQIEHALHTRAKIISLAIASDAIDPLQVLRKFGKSDQPNFYFEKQDFHRSGYALELTQGYSFIALESALTYTTDSSAIFSSNTASYSNKALSFNTESFSNTTSSSNTASSNAKSKQHRFEQAKQFIQTLLQQSALVGSAEVRLAGPHFFCNFTFADQIEQDCFPAARVVLPKWQVSRQGDRSYVTANFVPDYSCDPTAAQLLQDFEEFLTQLPQGETGEPSCELPHYPEATACVAQPEQFTQAVQRGLEAIAAGDLDKIVLAHPLDVTLPSSFDRVAALERLRHHYPDCYRFLASNGQGQHFIGASPERLVSLDQQQLRADTLAGSAPRGTTPHQDAALAQQLLQSPKERHEHQIVLEFITTALQQLHLTPHQAELGLLQLSNIQHLHTPVSAQVPPDLHLLDIVAQLHPTPAVAGLCRQTQSRQLACELIRQWEGFERSLYAAPIGWVDHQGNGEFAVGIRSALIDGNSARLFAGAGIVAGSDPQQELAEVNLKLQALLSVLV